MFLCIYTEIIFNLYTDFTTYNYGEKETVKKKKICVVIKFCKQNRLFVSVIIDDDCFSSNKSKVM